MAINAHSKSSSVYNGAYTTKRKLLAQTVCNLQIFTCLAALCTLLWSVACPGGGRGVLEHPAEGQSLIAGGEEVVGGE